MRSNDEIPEEVGELIWNRAQAAGMDIELFAGQILIENVKEFGWESRPKTTLDDFVRRQNARIDLHPRLDHAIHDGRKSFDVERG